MVKNCCFILFYLNFVVLAHTAFTGESAPELNSRAAVLMDAATGAVLFTKNPDEKIPPASLTKLVTIYVALEEAERKNIPLDAIMNLPPESWARNQPPRSSLMLLDEGQRVTLRDLILGLSIVSGNDAAVAVALNFAPDIEYFAAAMTNAVQKLGLYNTYFVEPSGISEENLTTALEFSQFCREYIKRYPENLVKFHSIREFSYPRPENMPFSNHNSMRIKKNSNGLLGIYEGVDGLKTGYIDESGYNIALTAERNGTRFIAVLLGVPAKFGSYFGPYYRNVDGAALLDWGFNHFKTIRVKYPDFGVVKVWKGKKNYVSVTADIEGNAYGSFTVNKDRKNNCVYETKFFQGITAPVSAGEIIGEFALLDDDGELARMPLYAAAAVEKANVFKRIWDSIIMFFKKIKDSRSA